MPVPMPNAFACSMNEFFSLKTQPNPHFNVLPDKVESSLPALANSSEQAAKPRAVLTCEQAIAIFQLRPEHKIAAHSKKVACAFQISDKTVRDIWRGRTWYRETLHLDPLRIPRNLRQPGRPLGRKDSISRKKHEKMQSQLDYIHLAENDPFHDDWPNWERADLCPLVDSLLFLARPLSRPM